MRTSDVLQKSCRNPPYKNFDFREMLPMQLKDRVSGKQAKLHDVACLPEMMQLFTCLNGHDFDTLKCPKEVNVFQDCYRKHMEAKADYKSKGSLGVLTPGLKVNELTSQQVNTLLQKYPIRQFMKKIRW